MRLVKYVPGPNQPIEVVIPVILTAVFIVTSAPVSEIFEFVIELELLNFANEFVVPEPATLAEAVAHPIPEPVEVKYWPETPPKAELSNN